ncbi:hypothetical protein IAT38_007336 [Cryptococcus sp. DSM 104549]
MPPSANWFLDFQGGEHLAGNASWLVDIVPLPTSVTFTSASELLQATHKGRVHFANPPLTIDGILIVEGHTENRLSISKLLSLGFELHLTKEVAQLEQNGGLCLGAEPVGLGETRWKLEVVRGEAPTSEAVSLSPALQPATADNSSAPINSSVTPVTPVTSTISNNTRPASPQPTPSSINLPLL